jgi:hypothetical protein
MLAAEAIEEDGSRALGGPSCEPVNIPPERLAECLPVSFE